MLVEGLFDCDLTELQGWSRLRADEQQRILQLGLQYVRRHSPSPNALAAGRSGAEQKWLNYHLRHAQRRAADIATQQSTDTGDVRPSVAGLLALLRRSDVRMVRNGADALDVLIERLNEIQHRITFESAFRDLWNENSPKR
jgi:hypothetical protein